MRVVHVTDCYLPRLGGIEAQVHALAKQQAAAGHDVSVVTATPRSATDRVRTEVIDGVQVYRSIIRVPWQLPVHHRPGRELARVLQHLRDQGRPADVIHLHFGMVGPFTQGALPLLVRLRLPTLVSVHSLWGASWRGFGFLAQMCGARRWPVQWSAVSSAAAEPVRRALGAGSAASGSACEVMVVPNGVDLSYWRAVAASTATSADTTVVRVVAAQRLAPRKRTYALLRMIRVAQQQLPTGVTLNLTIAGAGPQLSSLRRYVHRAGLHDSVHFAGRLSRTELGELYASADVFAAPATQESFGIAALEARAAGLPVLARAGTGVSEFVTHDVNGLFACSDTEFIAALQRLATEPAFRQRLAAYNHDHAPTFGWDDVLAQTEVAYVRAQQRVSHRNRATDLGGPGLCLPAEGENPFAHQNPAARGDVGTDSGW